MTLQLVEYALLLISDSKNQNRVEQQKYAAFPTLSHSNSHKRAIQQAHLSLLEALHNADPQSSNIAIREQYVTIFPPLSQPRIDRMLKHALRYRQKHPLRYHPNKLEESNIQYCHQFLEWVGRKI
jgi:hypothetical protein